MEHKDSKPKRHKWEWAKGGSTGQKQCTRCGMVKFPGDPFTPASFFMGRKLVAEGKTPPCEPKESEGLAGRETA